MSKPGRFAPYAWGVLAYNLLVVLWGAFVRASGSGAGCGSHWPLCNGEVVPRAAELETLVEFTHRITSGLALLSVAALLVWAIRAYPAGHRVRLGAKLSMGFMILEALVGAGLVLLELVAENASMARAYWMIAHLINTFLLIGSIALTAWWTSEGPPVRREGRGGLRLALGAGVVGMLAVGASGAIAALGDTLFPSSSLAEGLRLSFSADAHPLLQLRKLHPLLAVLVGAYLVGVARWAARLRPSAATRRLSALVLALYGTQLLAGAVNVILLAPLWLQLFHLLLADLVWLSFVLLAASALAVPPVGPPAARRPEEAPIPASAGAGRTAPAPREGGRRGG